MRLLKAPADVNGQMDNPEMIEILDKSLIMKFEGKVDQLAVALAFTLKMVSEKM